MKDRLSNAYIYSEKFLNYQIVTKLLLALIFLPLFNLITNLLLASAGISGFTSSDFKSFIFSPQGLLLGIIGFIFLVCVIGFDINAFIIMSKLFSEGHESVKVKNILVIALKSALNFFSLTGIFIVLYISLLLPLLNVSSEFSPLPNLKIPNFISSVIFSTPLYLTIYVVAIIVLTIVFFLGIFTVHFMLLTNTGRKNALKNSFKMMRKNYQHFLKRFIIFNIKLALFSVLISGIALIFVLLTILFTQSGEFSSRFLLIFILLLTAITLSLIPLVAFPLEITRITELFSEYYEQDNKKLINLTEKYQLKKQTEAKKINKKLVTGAIILFLLFDTGFSALMAYSFDEVFKSDVNIKLVSHRNGGFMDAENSLEGLEKAIAENADFVEFDVQRSKDGIYFINHDPTFKRAAGDNRAVKDLTADEIAEIRIKNAFDPSMPNRKVPTLEQIMNTAEGKIGLFIELKGETADEQMVDDVVQIIKDKNMLESAVILSLDYDIIEYTADKYPEVLTGFLYYFAVGDIKKLKGDYLVMEEAEATEEKLAAVHSVGKKAIVWTVNTKESMDKFLESNVDGIITDDPIGLKQAIVDRSKRSDIEIIMNFVFEQ